MKTPEECTSLAEIRAEIDRLDQEIIALLGQRFAYVKAAAQYKTSEAGVKAPDRLAAMIEQRRTWAAAAGLDPEAIEQMYRNLVSYFIAEETKHWQRSGES